MPLTQSDLGKRVLLRGEDGKWDQKGGGHRLVGFDYENMRALSWEEKQMANKLDMSYADYALWLGLGKFVTVRFSNGSVWRLAADRVRVIDDQPATEQPPCLPGTVDAIEEETD